MPSCLGPRITPLVAGAFTLAVCWSPVSGGSGAIHSALVGRRASSTCVRGDHQGGPFEEDSRGSDEVE